MDIYTEVIKSDILQSFCKMIQLRIPRTRQRFMYINNISFRTSWILSINSFLCFMVDWDPRILRANASSIYFTITQCISCSLTYWYRKCEIKFRNNRKLSLNSSFATFLVILILPRSTYNLYHGLMIMWLNQWSNKSEFRKK